jgi:hypothetical protein
MQWRPGGPSVEDSFGMTRGRCVPASFALGAQDAARLVVIRSYHNSSRTRCTTGIDVIQADRLHRSVEDQDRTFACPRSGQPRLAHDKVCRSTKSDAELCRGTPTPIDSLVPKGIPLRGATRRFRLDSPFGTRNRFGTVIPRHRPCPTSSSCDGVMG